MLPNNLQYSTETLKKITLNDIQVMFKSAKNQGCLNEFATKFWSDFEKVRNDDGKITAQSIVDSLERYKRYLGRYYDKTKSPFVVPMYNKLENQIQWMLNNYGECYRLSKPYKISLKWRI